MSGRADIIRRAIMLSMAFTSMEPVVFDFVSGATGSYYTHEDYDAAHAALDALVAENQRLRDAGQTVATAFTAWAEDWNDGTYAYYKSDDLMVACVALRAALDGTPSEDTE
jgi:hypothetical protein